MSATKFLHHILWMIFLKSFYILLTDQIWLSDCLYFFIYLVICVFMVYCNYLLYSLWQQKFNSIFWGFSVARNCLRSWSNPLNMYEMIFLNVYSCYINFYLLTFYSKHTGFWKIFPVWIKIHKNDSLVYYEINPPSYPTKI